MNFYARLALTVLVVIALAEFIPELVNSILVLILIGILLMRWPAFSRLAANIGITAS